MSPKIQEIGPQNSATPSLTLGKTAPVFVTGHDLQRPDWLAGVMKTSNYGICQDGNPFELPREFCPIWPKACSETVSNVSCALANSSAAAGL